jgi:hypothetical protein
MDYLEELSNNEFHSGQRVRCMAHVINLAVQEFLKETKSSCKEYRDYLKQTTNCELIESEEEDKAFIQVILYFNTSFGTLQ